MGFQRQHMPSLLSQCFDPCFVFNGIYHNIARLTNREVIKTGPSPMPMTYKIQKKHYPLLEKLAVLFFETQKLSTRRNLLLKNTYTSKMDNYLIGFSDGSNQFSTSCVYLISSSTDSNMSQATLITTSSRLSEDTLIAKTPESIPGKEMHGLLLCVSSMVQILEGLQECGFKVKSCHIGVDALSQILGLMAPPSQSRRSLRKHYASINVHLYTLANITKQVKEDIIFWLNQEEVCNPADKLGKFDIEKDPVHKWVKLQKEILQPDWLQDHPRNYLHRLIKSSKEKIRLSKTGGYLRNQSAEKILGLHLHTEPSKDEDIMVSYIEANEKLLPARKKNLDFHPLDRVVERFGHKGSSYVMKIMGYVTYFAHRWVDKLYLMKHKVCSHEELCECKKKLLEQRQVDRPFRDNPIRDITFVDGKQVKASTADEETLIKVGLLVSTLISADFSTNPAIPKHMTKYTKTQFRMNGAICQAYSGRFLRYQTAVNPARHTVAWVELTSPIIEIISREVHTKLSCGLGPQSYMNAIHVAGFCATGLLKFIKDQIGSCESCAQVKMLMSGETSMNQTLKNLYGPDDFLGLAASADPLSILAVDEAGPFYIQDSEGGYKTTYILVCVEILTYKVHLIPLPKLDTLHFVRALEILQSLRGKFSTLIMDYHTSHKPLSQAQHEEQQSKQSFAEFIVPSDKQIYRQIIKMATL